MIDEVWNSVNPLFNWCFYLLSYKNFATMGTWYKDFSLLRRVLKYYSTELLYPTLYSDWGLGGAFQAHHKFKLLPPLHDGGPRKPKKTSKSKVNTTDSQLS